MDGSSGARGDGHRFFSEIERQDLIAAIGRPDFVDCAIDAAQLLKLDGRAREPAFGGQVRCGKLPRRAFDIAYRHLGRDDELSTSLAPRFNSIQYSALD